MITPGSAEYWAREYADLFDRMNTELQLLRADAVRLEWLMKHAGDDFENYPPWSRVEIDATMRLADERRG